jgi:hypothetical protein
MAIGRRGVEHYYTLEIARCGILPCTTILEREAAMRIFVTACVAAIVLAVVGRIVLDHVQEPASVAFSTASVRL